MMNKFLRLENRYSNLVLEMFPFFKPTTWDIDISLQRPRVSPKLTILERFVIFLFVLNLFRHRILIVDRIIVFMNMNYT